MVGLAGLIAFVAALYAVALSESIEYTERTLLSAFIEDEFHYLAAEYDRGGLHRLPEGVLLYESERAPERFRGRGHGYAELGDDPAVFLFKGVSPDGRELTLVLDQMDFEARERTLQSMVWLSLLLVIALAALAGWRLSRLVVRPIERLAEDMRRAAKSPTYVPVAPAGETAPADAVAELACICDEALRNVHQALDREKAFTGDVSHELRTPLTVIETSAEMLALTDLTPAQQRSLDKITRSAAAMRSLLEVFLALARGTQARAAELVRAGAVLPELTVLWNERAREKCRRKGLAANALSVEMLCLAPSLGRHDAAHLETILNNLLKNAVDYASEGLVLIGETAEGIWVADSGPGVAPADRERIFEPFVRATEAAPGAGLGLSIALRLARRNGWRLSLEDAQSMPAALRERFAERGLSVGAVFCLAFDVRRERLDSH